MKQHRGQLFTFPGTMHVVCTYYYGTIESSLYDENIFGHFNETVSLTMVFVTITPCNHDWMDTCKTRKFRQYFNFGKFSKSPKLKCY